MNQHVTQNHTPTITYSQQQLADIDELIWRIQAAAQDGLMGMTKNRADSLHHITAYARRLSEKMREGVLNNE